MKRINTSEISIINILLLTLAGIVNAVGVTMFLAPVKLYDSGISGTKIGAKGSYTDDDKTIVYFVLNRFQIGKMKKIVHAVDLKAYITISEVADVFKSNI